MAPVNPTINPTNDPNYVNNSRAVDVPTDIRPKGVETNQIMPRGQEIGDRSAEYMGKAAQYGMEADAVNTKSFGDLFAGLVSIGDFIGKAGVNLTNKYLENKVYDIVNKERNLEINTLENIQANPGLRNILNTPAEAPTSGELENLPDRLQSLVGARDSGKISNTYYLGRLMAEAKDLRARYPGFRQEIDQMFSKASGMNIANAMVTSLTHQINSQQSALATDRKSTLTYIQSNLGFPNAQEKFRQFSNGEITRQDVMDWAAPYEQEKYQLTTGMARLQAKAAQKKDVASDAAELTDQGIAITVGRSVDTLMGRLGLNNIDDVVGLDGKFKSGAVSSQQWEQIGQDIENHKAMLRVSLKRDADKQGMTKLLGADEVNKRIEEGLKPLDALAQRVYARDAGGLFSAARAIKGMQDDDQKRLLDNPKVGPYFRQVQVMKNIGGEQWIANFNLDSLKEGIDEKYSNYYKSWKQEVVSQTSMQTSGLPVTLNDVFDDFKAKKVNDPKMTSGLIKQISEGITDPKSSDAIKENYALTAFSPQNRGFISRLNPDGVDERGRPIKGQNAVFQQLTTPEITKEMKRLGEKNPQIWTNYQNWAKETFGNELLNKEINDLKRIGEDPNLKIGYDADNHRFEVKYVPTPEAISSGRGRTGLSAVSQDTAYVPYVHARNSINRINSGLYNLKNLADASNQDIDAYLLRTIVEAGGDLGGVRNIPNEMLRQIDLSRQFNSRFKAK